MHSWERVNETSLPDKKEFYSNLKMENITDADYKHLGSLGIFQNTKPRKVS